METPMATREEICRRAGEYFGNGFHCAGAIAKAVIDGLEVGGQGGV